MCTLKWFSYLLRYQEMHAFIALTSRRFSVSVSIFLLFYTAIEVYVYIYIYIYIYIFFFNDRLVAFLPWSLYGDDLLKIFISDIEVGLLCCLWCLQGYISFRERSLDLNFRVGKTWILIPALSYCLDLNCSNFLSFSFSILIWIIQASKNYYEITWGYALKEDNADWLLFHSSYIYR